MSKTTPVFFTEYADQSPKDGDEFVIPEDLSTLSLEELGALKAQATEHFDAVYADGTTVFTEDDVKLLGALTEGIEALQTAIGDREAEAEALATQARELATRAKGGEPEAAAEEAPVEVAEPAMAEAVLAADPVTPAPRQATRINLSRLNGRQAPKPAPEPPTAQPTMRDILKAAGSGAGFAAGQGLDWLDAAKILDAKMAGFNRTQYAGAQRAGKHLREEFSILNIQKPLAEDLIVRTNDPAEIDRVLRRAMDERRLPGGSLVAAGGWCAPSETIYDLCELETRAGLFDLPEIGMARGGINRTLGPDFATLYGSTGFVYTEAEVIAGDWNGVGAGVGSKPCYDVACPDFEDIRMGVAGLCITAGLLQARGYPELLARVLRGALVAHDHRVAATLIAQVVAGSTAVNLSGLAGFGATSGVLEAIELQVTHTRYVNRLAEDATLEAVFPFWIKGVIRADLALRSGVDLISVQDSRILGWFRERGVSAQFVYNWQDLTGAAGAFTAWPNTVQFLLYPAGTWVKGASDVINLDTVHDSIQLGQNQFTGLFSEEGFVAAKMCHDSRVITVPLCRNGATGGTIEIDCATGGLAASETPANGTQTVTITGTPTGGTFTLSFYGQVTSAIAYNASAATVEAALLALSAVDAGDVVVTGGPGPGTPWVVTFQGDLPGVVPLMEAVSSLTGGTTPAVTVTGV